ncbi:MAG: rane-associated phospholipid phosphatase [Paucimonas sp.]|nr:rane-associated phospholipid phosphatase [Paucimonas sp.]
MATLVGDALLPAFFPLLSGSFMLSWQHLTFIGDSVITLPAAAAIIVWLLAAGAWRLALTWTTLLGSALFLVLATKVAFIGWGIGIPALDFTGISGHAMRACAVLPVLAYLLFQQARASVRALGVLAAFCFGLVISLSRLVLHFHSASEVVSGIGLGTLVAVNFLRHSAGQPALQLQRWVVGLTMLALVPSSYAEPSQSQRWVTKVALYLSGHDRPYVRKANGELARAPMRSVEH